MLMMVLGIAFLAAAGAMDLVFRFRMKHLGHKWMLLRGGTFNYREYHQVRRANGWPAWPVYVMWAAYGCGIALLIAGFFIEFGTHPPGR